MFSVCSRYMECSKQEFCIHPDEEMKKECMYNSKLKKGINFYNKSKYKGVFLVINNRMFHIGRRSSYGSYTYDLRENEKEDVIPKLKEKGITIENRTRYNLCKNDFISDSDRACCIVILTIGDKKYNIKNFNTRCITHDTAIQVKDYLREKGFLAAVQVNGAISVDYKAQNRNKKEKKASKKEKVQVKQEKKLKAAGHDVLEGQISMFELLAI